jgi:branched-chain amino acid transport system ATP-binding protein
MIRLESVNVFYDDLQVLWSVDIDVADGAIIAILGANGAGKSTAMSSMSGLVRVTKGRVLFGGQDITNRTPQERVALGLTHVMERQRVFRFMSVRENLRLGAFLPEARKLQEDSLAQVLELFPFLKDRMKVLAGSLSGGEQQMLAMGRGLMARPRAMLLDEPLLGLSPQRAEHVIDVIRRLNSTGITIVFIEQNVTHSLELANHAYILEAGRVALSGSAESLRGNDEIRRVYMGLAPLDRVHMEER